MNTKINPAGLTLIKKFESLHDGDLSVIGLQPKMCPAGIWTIGWGRALTNAQGDFLRGMSGRSEAYAKYGSVSEEQAEGFLLEDTEKLSNDISDLLRVGVTKNQFSALVSLAYNIGLGALKKSTVMKKLNAGELSAAADAFLLWNKSGGRVLRGLSLRRDAERQLFLTPDEVN